MIGNPVIAYLALGANLGDRAANIHAALTILQKDVIVETVSSIYETPPIGYEQQPKFLNAACSIKTQLCPQDLLVLTKRAETALGRRTSFRNAPRPIDVDILLYGENAYSSPDLTIPHPRMVDRAFVLVPLAEIAASARHPLLGKTIAELLASIDQNYVRRFQDVTIR